jgi:integrase
MEGQPKTKAGRRSVSLDSVTLAMLAEHLTGRQTGRVFQTRNGTPLNNREICLNVLYPICDRLGIRRGGCHAFRHGRVSLMQAARLPKDFILSEIGHTSLRMTGRYTHFSDQQRREMAEGLLSCGQNGELWSSVN